MTMHTHPLHHPDRPVTPPVGYRAFTIRYSDGGLSRSVDVLVAECDEMRLTEALDNRYEDAFQFGYECAMGTEGDA